MHDQECVVVCCVVYCVPVCICASILEERLNECKLVTQEVVVESGE